MSNQYDKLLNCIKEDTKEEKQDFLYRIDERGVVIERYIGRKKCLIVPGKIDDQPVYKIDDTAFYEDEKLKKITLPDTLRIIGKEAFAGSSLETAILPKSLLIIEERAFADSSLKSVNMPESVSVIGEETFSGTEITSITIPRLVMSIGARAFEYTNILSVRIPSNVKSISQEMFKCCEELHTVIIEGAKTIEASAFEGCGNLKNINLPDTLTLIEDNAFSGTDIEFMIVPQSVQYIGEDNFPGSHVAILSDNTEVYLGNDDYSYVTLYCNQSNINARKVAKEYHMKQKSLSTFAKISADYYKTFEPETSIEIESPKVFCEPNYCETKCEFYTTCQGNKETCIKEIFDKMISQLSTREERIIRLLFGIGELKEDSIIIILQALNMIPLQDGDEFADVSEDDISEDVGSCHISKFEHLRNIEAKALRKLRHPARSRALRSIDVGLVLLSANETNYFNLWCAIFGVRPDSRQVELEYYTERKRAEEEQRKRNEEELANASDEELPRIRKKIMARSTPIDDLDLRVRTYNCLKHAGVNTVEDLVNMTWEEFIRIRNLGKKSAEEVLFKLEQLGFSFSSSDE